MPPKARNKQEELTAYNRPQSEWESFFEELSNVPGRSICTTMSSFESMFKVDDLRSELSVRKFDANLPVELLKLDAMVVTKVDWYPSEFFRPGAPIPPPVQARRDLIRTFVTPMCDLFTKLHSADEHEDLQLLLLDAMIALVHYNCEKIVGNVIFATVAEPILLNIHGNSAAILANIFHLMFQLCSGCLRLDVYKFVMENETMLLSSFKTMSMQEVEHQLSPGQHPGAVVGSTQAFDAFACFLRKFAETCLDLQPKKPEIVDLMFPLLATLVEIAPEETKVAAIHLIRATISEEHYDCWLTLPHLKSAIQTALDFDQWETVETAEKCQPMISAAMYVVYSFMEHTSSDQAALAAGNEVTGGRLVEVCKKVLLMCGDCEPGWTGAEILSRLVSMNTVSLTDCCLLPTLIASISKFPHETCAAELLCEFAPLDDVDAIEYLLSCGVLSLITRCFQGGLARMKQLQWALSFLEEVIDAYGNEYFEVVDGDSAIDSWYSRDLVVPYQFPFMLFLKEQHPDVVDGLKHVVETFLAGEQGQFHERAQVLLEDIGDIV